MKEQATDNTANAKAAQYIADPAFVAANPTATTLAPKNPGNAFSAMVSVCLGNAYEKEIPATKDKPAELRRIPTATPEQLKWLFEQGNPHIKLDQ